MQGGGSPFFFLSFLSSSPLHSTSFMKYEEKASRLRENEPHKITFFDKNKSINLLTKPHLFANKRRHFYVLNSCIQFTNNTVSKNRTYPSSSKAIVKRPLFTCVCTKIAHNTVLTSRAPRNQSEHPKQCSGCQRTTKPPVSRQ